MTADERAQAVRELGYTDREAAFLALTLRHGGYFVTRQFVMSSGASMGKAVAQLTGRLLARGDGRVIETRRGYRIYHLCARQLYEPTESLTPGLWRRRSPVAIKTRLMGLDYVLAHADERFLGTEAERLAYLTAVLRLRPEQLPQPQFANRSLIGVASGDSPGLSFVYLAEAGSSLPGFCRYLRAYWRLFAALVSCRIVYASDSPRLFGRAEAMFARLNAGGFSPRAEKADPEALVDYFKVRRAYEAGQLDSFTKATLDRLRDDRQRFRSALVERAYERWTAGTGIEEAIDAIQGGSRQTPIIRTNARFATYWLKHSYVECGTRSSYSSSQGEG